MPRFGCSDGQSSTIRKNAGFSLPTSSCQRWNSGGSGCVPGAHTRLGFCSVRPTARSPCALPFATSGERVSAAVGVGVAVGFLADCLSESPQPDRSAAATEGDREQRSQTADTSSSSATRKEEPQPQAATTLGLSTLKPAPCRPST